MGPWRTLIEATFACASCGEHNDTLVDPTQGARHSYVEDCRVCCRPQLLTVRVVDGEAEVTAAPESE